MNTIHNFVEKNLALIVGAVLFAGISTYLAATESLRTGYLFSATIFIILMLVHSAVMLAVTGMLMMRSHRSPMQILRRKLRSIKLLALTAGNALVVILCFLLPSITIKYSLLASLLLSTLAILTIAAGKLLASRL